MCSVIKVAKAFELVTGMYKQLTKHSYIIKNE